MLDLTGTTLGPQAIDAFAVRLWAASPAGVDHTIRRLVAKRRRRPVSEAQVAAQLAPHFPAMSTAWLVTTKAP